MFKPFLFVLLLGISSSIAWAAQPKTPAEEKSPEMGQNLQEAPAAPQDLRPLTLPALPLEEQLFGFTDVKKKAADFAAKSFQNPDGQVPRFLLDISYDQWRKIRFRPENSLWRDEDLPFEVQFFHPGLFYNRLVEINVVNGNLVEPLKISGDLFNYEDEELRAKVSELSLGFAGFRLHAPIKSPYYKDEVAVFLGASYFRAVTKNSQYGLSARGLAVDTALPSGEEFPYFREFWIQKPEPNQTSITVYALMDSPRLTGAYRFVIKPGDQTVMEVESALFLRQQVEKIGIGALTSMYLFGEAENGQAGDYRPEVHDSDGLLTCNAQGSWTWTPLANPQRLAILSTPMPSPKAFGLFQRDPVFDHYQDLEARYEQRPSLLVEPKGDWGPGRIELIEIPSIEEIHDNMVAFWVPDKKLNEQGQATYPKQMNFAYTLRWMTPGENPHELAQVVSTRIARTKDTLRFVVDFAEGPLSRLSPKAAMSSVIELPDKVRLLNKQLQYNEETRGWRLVFQVAVPQANLLNTLLPKDRNMRFTALLKQGENFAEPLTETWQYDLSL